MVCSSPWSVALRYKPAAFSGDFFQKGDNSISGNQGVRLSANGSGAISIYWFNGSWYSPSISVPMTTLGAEYSIAFVYSGGTSFTIYVNGVATQVTLNNAFGGSVYPLTIGGLTPAGQYLNGTIDNFAWFDKALTQAQVTLLHNAAVGSPYRVSGTILDANGSPVTRTLRAYRRDTGVLLGSGQSSALGVYGIDTWFNGEVQVVMLDDALGTLENDQILRTIPV